MFDQTKDQAFITSAVELIQQPTPPSSTSSSSTLAWSPNMSLAKLDHPADSATESMVVSTMDGISVTPSTPLSTPTTLSPSLPTTMPDSSGDLLSYRSKGVVTAVAVPVSNPSPKQDAFIDSSHGSASSPALSVNDNRGERMELVIDPSSSLSPSETVFRNRVEGQKNRFTFLDVHNAALEKVFELHPYPSKAIKSQLSEHVGCTEVQVQNWFARRRTRAAQELQEKKEKQAMLEKLDKSLNSVSDIASEAPIEQRPAPSPHIGLNKEEKESIEAIIGAALFNKLTGAATKIESKVGADIKAESRAGSVTGPLSSSEVGLMISRITRGNSFVKTEDIKTAVELMDAASDYEGRKYIMNALLFTKAQPVLQKFVQLKGPNILRIWMLEAKKDPNTEANKDILLKSIAILKTLPFDFQTLYDSKVGRVMKKLAQDKDIDKEISHQASQLKDKWTYEFTEGSSSVSGSTSDAASVSANKGRKRDRDNQLHEISDLPLPKFIKGKPAAPTETSKKSNVVENTGFFRELMRSAPQGSASIPNKSLAIVSLTKPSSPPSLPSSLSIKTQVTTASGSNISPTTAISSTTLSSPKDRSESPVSSDSQPSQLLESSVVKEDADTFKPSTTLEPSDSMNMNNEPAATMPIVKSKKAVRFKADHELVSIQFIEPRGFYSDEEEQFDIDSNNQSYFGDEDTYMQHSVKPPFMMTEQQLEVLLRGDKWQPPLRLQLEPTGQPERGFKSVEKGVQEKRESETLSVYYRQTTYIPASPAEPDPEPLQTDTGSSSSPSNNTAAVLAALSAAVASSQSSKPNVIYETPTENSAALLSSLAASGSALNPGYNAYGTQQQQQQTTSFAGLYGSLAAYAQPLQYQQQYQAQYHPQQQQAPQQQAMVTPTLTNAMLAAERAKELLDMLQQTTQQQPGNQLQQQQEQQTSYYAAYQQTMQQQQQQQQRQQGQQQGQQQQAYGYAFYQSHQSQSTS